MAPRVLGFLVPGALAQRTGGYLYDARMVQGLRAWGWQVEVSELPGVFPGPDATAAAVLDRALDGFAAHATVVIDGLAGGAFPEILARHGDRLRLIYLLHHPLGHETGQDAGRSAWLLERERAALEHVEVVIVTSTYTQTVIEGWGVPRARLRCVPPGVAPAEPAEGPLVGEPAMLLTVGAVVPRKGQDVLIEALEQLRDRDWRAVLACDPSRDPAFAGQVSARIAAARLGDRVRQVGECTGAELERLYRSASLFVLPSWYEGFGMAFTEAMAHGLPVVGTTGGAIPFTVPEEAGWLVAPGDAGALAGVLAQALDDPGCRRTLGRAARAHARSLPDWEGAVAAFNRALAG